MKLIVGLGNPGIRYAHTRHNIGFMAAAKFAQQIGASETRNRFDGEVAEGQVAGTKAIVLCPSTYMNASGGSVRKAVGFYKIDPADVLVICDDFNLALGRLRVRAKGSSGGQKGLADIIRLLGTEEVPRLRIGISPPPAGWNIPDYVLSKFRSDEEVDVERVTDRAAQAAHDFVRHDVAFCMNAYNGTELDK
ncbi:Peptidyl-tRNA hydrolase [Rosistilla oblonga]|uniref:Peptidyl-tRNA hydrolase n=1 Tax=Rosistilla oblonga TaxID=2527990 RepID=A0A518IR90_9BACT|nr:aminoacyl-tRNA hydrolase [Rosistilla oblonga]QDV11618.1 Peptidyl-tRNA hydrolase [Rosistilla oblonga]QDV55608.1 Peptidyl-tRNA hydrolase [Rosistilla oblonga]